jgi:hypothetical protein
MLCSPCFPFSKYASHAARATPQNDSLRQENLKEILRWSFAESGATNSGEAEHIILEAFSQHFNKISFAVERPPKIIDYL